MGFQDSGFSTRITFANADSGVTAFLREEEITPFTLSMGGANDVTSMQNTRYRTKKGKHLINIEPATLTIQYDPAILTDMVALMGVNQEMVITMPDGHTWTFWGEIDNFSPGPLSVSEDKSTATITLEVTNLNDSDVETGPVYA